MPKFPTRDNLSSPASLRSGRPRLSAGDVDASARFKGVQNLAGAIIGTGDVLAAREEQEKRERDALELAKAELDLDTGLRSLNRKYDNDPDYATHGDRFGGDAGALTDSTASGISDPKKRELWRLKALNQSDSARSQVIERSDRHRKSVAVTELQDKLDRYKDFYEDPDATQDERDRALQSIDNIITLGERSGIVAPNAARALRARYRQGAIEGEARTRAKIDPDGYLKEIEKPGAGFDMAFPEDVQGAIDAAVAETGINATWMQVFARVESSGDPKLTSAKGKGSYHGLYQLSEEEFKKYGPKGGDIFDPVDNAMAAARKLSAEAAEYEQKYGQAPTLRDLYLIHQQGEAGYAAHIANPGKVAWENIRQYYTDAAARKRGYADGEAYAKAAIWNNIPDDVKDRFGIVENVTSAEFMDVWEDKLGRFSARTGGRYAELPPSLREELKVAAERSRNSYLQAARSEIKSDLDGDVERIRLTGQSGNPDLETAARVLTPNQINDHLLKRRVAHVEFNAMNGIEALPDTGLTERIAANEPDPSEDLYAERVKIYDKLNKRVRELRKLRDEDPAAAVADLPDVQVALQGIEEDNASPESWQRLARARLDAQAAIDIPKGLRTPITKDEARVRAAPLKGLDRGTELTEAVRQMLTDVDRDFGPYARSVAVSIVDLAIKDRDISEVTSGIIRKTLSGRTLSPVDVRAAEEATSALLVQRSMMPFADPFTQLGLTNAPPSPSAALDPFANYGMAPATVMPPPEAIMALRNNPSLAREFEAKYGLPAAEFLTGN
jgi:hypothetical protein